MKKILSFFAVAAMLSLAFSCTKPEPEPTPGPTPGPDPTPTEDAINEITATLEGAGIKTVWAEGDAILVYAVTDAGDVDAKYVLSAGAGTANGTFKAEGTAQKTGATAYYACYPYSSIDFAQHNTFSYTLEAEQTAANPVFGATTDGKAYKFSTPLAGVELKLTGKGNAAKIVIEDKNTNNIINGNATYNAKTAKFSVKNGSASKNTVTKSFETVALGSEPVSVFFEVPAGCLETGASLTVYNPANGIIGIAEIPAQDLKAGNLTTVEVAVEAASSVADLSATESANCYIITEPGTYKFKTVRGNSPENVGSAATAEILWETYNNNEEVVPNSIIAEVSYASDYVTFKTPETLKKGNAVIAVKDAAGTILWSWHIWVVADMVIEGTNLGFEGSLEVMNYNLGAIGEVGTVESYGLVYEWGRKDPFLSAGELGGESPATVSGVAVSYTEYIDFEHYVGIDADQATQNPTLFVLTAGVKDEEKDWLKPSDGSRWSDVKAMHDPCPAGWRIPLNSDNGLFTCDSPVKDEETGAFFTVNKSFKIPASRYKSYEDGHLSSDTKYWTCSDCSGVYAQAYRLSDAASKTRRKAEGCSVRCVKDVPAAE